MDDRNLRDDVVQALDFSPCVEATDIGVAVKDGVVTLSGHVGSYTEKTAAEHCVQRVRGVRAIAENIAVRYAFEKQTADDQIAHRAISILSWNSDVPKDLIKVKVAKGVVTLAGQVPWHFQKVAADKAIRKLTGVVAVVNRITIAPHASASDVKAQITAAFKRDAALESGSIQVYVEDDEVRLEGCVQALHERKIAENAAWSAPGVRDVVDNLKLA
jgi:osmotically-inducible protein OsmY